MHSELRYQAKTHTISEKEISKNKNSASSPLFFLLKTIKKKNNKDMLKEKEITSSPSL
jgi:hypothetical protein